MSVRRAAVRETFSRFSLSLLILSVAVLVGILRPGDAAAGVVCGSENTPACGYDKAVKVGESLDDCATEWPNSFFDL